ncbi:MAG: hypothetical protein Roseis2KO_04740 [Roseivirga sp.]
MHAYLLWKMPSVTDFLLLTLNSLVGSRVSFEDKKKIQKSTLLLLTINEIAPFPKKSYIYAAKFA